jgi:hypothetical protein
MADIDLQLRAIEMLVRIHSSIKSMQTYPPADSTMTDTIEVLYLHLLDRLRQESPSIYAELEKKQRSQENISNLQGDAVIEISSLMDIFDALRVKNISFYKDPENKELRIFLRLLAKKSQPVQEEAPMQEPVMESLAIKTEPVKEESLTLENDQEIVAVPSTAEGAAAQIEPDKKEYITLEKEQEIISEPVTVESATLQVEPVKEERLTLDKEQEITSPPATAEGQISGTISELEKVFKRLNAMDGDLSSMPSDEKMAEIKKLVTQAAGWLEKEETFTPEYKNLCERLETLLQDFISYGFFAEAVTIINVFSKINSGALKRDNKVREVSLKVIQNLASDNNFNILFKEINTNERNKQNDACQIFAGFGDIVINKLLDGLKKATDSKARISIIHIIEEMGEAAIPAVKATIDMNAPWYYLRNMAYLLGRIGNEKSTDAFKPLLLHKEKRVRKEAFKSAVQTGGNMRGALFLSILPQVDKELRISIIEILGKIKYVGAVTDLQFMLKSKYNTLAKEEQTVLQEEICKALGAIGSPDAVKILSEVAESKSILGMGTFPKEVKNAAERALSYIRRKDQTK